MLLDHLHDAHKALTDFMKDTSDKALPLSLCAVDRQQACLQIGLFSDGGIPLETYRRRLQDFTGDLPVQIAPVNPRRHATNTDKIRPIIGGTQIYTSYSKGSLGTLSVVGKLGGKVGFILSGHVAGDAKASPNRAVYQPINPPAANRIGSVKLISDWKNGAADAAWGEYVDQNAAPSLGLIWKDANSTYKVKSVKDSANSSQDDMVNMQGISSTSASSGKIQALGATVKFKAGEFDPEQTLMNQVVATYTTVSGDSGGPVFEITNGNDVALLGINVAEADGNDVLAYNRGNTPVPGTKYAIYTPWEEIVAALGAIDVINP